MGVLHGEIVSRNVRGVFSELYLIHCLSYCEERIRLQDHEKAV
jgi:hypothetical protein